MEYKYNTLQKQNKGHLSTSPRFDNAIGFQNSMYPLDSIRDPHNFMPDCDPNFSSGVGISSNLNNLPHRNEFVGDNFLNNSVGQLPSMPPLSSQNNLAPPTDLLGLDNYDRSFNQMRDFGGLPPLGNNHNTFEPHKIRRSLYSNEINSYQSDEDDDYSMNEDLEQNNKTYRQDQRPYNSMIPKSEVTDLLRDTLKFSSMDPLFETNQNNNQSNPNKKLVSDKPPCSSQMQSYKRQKLSNPSKIQESYPQTNIDHYLAGNDSQQYSSQILRPNLQNNFYYNFNNNFGQHQDSQSIAPPQQQQMIKNNVNTKSIEIQVSPEKLNEKEDDSKIKKRRRRQRNKKSDDREAENRYPLADYKNSEYAQYGMYPGYYGANPQYFNPQGRYDQSQYYQNAPHYQYPGQYPYYYQQQQMQNQKLPGGVQNFDDLKVKEQMRDYLRTMYYPFQNDQLKELVQQIDIYIQVLYQMLLLGKTKSNSSQGDTNDKESLAQKQLKYKVYSLLYDFQAKKEQTLKPFKLPEYQIPWIQNSKEEYLKMNPQVSYFQAPLLEIAPDIIEQISKPIQEPKSQLKFLNKYQPLINQFYLPSLLNYLPKGQGQQNQDILQDGSFQSQPSNLDGSTLPNPSLQASNNNRRKFSYVDDNFLLLGLRQYGYKDVDQIRNNWLPNKSTNEIKHRYKNLTCAKAPDNIIKRWKLTHNIPLSDQEEKQLAKAVKWFGSNTNRWTLISKCYLPNRSPQFLKLEYQNIVSDHDRAEKFGQQMLSDDEEEKQGFEDIDLDKISDDESSSDKLNNLQDLLANFIDEKSEEAEKQDISAINEGNEEEEEEEGQYEEIEL